MVLGNKYRNYTIIVTLFYRIIYLILLHPKIGSDLFNVLPCGQCLRTRYAYSRVLHSSGKQNKWTIQRCWTINYYSCNLYHLIIKLIIIYRGYCIRILNLERLAYKNIILLTLQAIYNPATQPPSCLKSPKLIRKKINLV